MANTSLKQAKKQKADEFYTQLPDIENELKHYKSHFKGKTIFCNCDDPYWSNFFYYFVAQFNELGLKKLITTHYIDNGISLFADIMPEKPYSLSITKAPKDLLTLERPAMVTHIIEENGGRHYLKGDGDFRSKESVEMLKEADIVVTNPPFSLFREYVAQLIGYEKKFIIIGNKNAITYKEIFQLIKENKTWVGVTPMGKDMMFDVPDYFAKELMSNKKEGSAYKIINGVVKGRSQAIWLTNLDHKKRHEDLILYQKYTAEEFPKYDNYDAIEVSKTADIPKDYKKAMGVPITFLDKFNPDQFEIIGLANDKREKDPAFIQATPYNLDEQHKNFVGFVLNGKATYARILIKAKGGN